MLLSLYRQARATLGADRRESDAHGVFPHSYSPARQISAGKYFRSESLCPVGFHCSYLDLQLHVFRHGRPTELDHSGRDIRYPDQSKRCLHIHHDDFCIQYNDRMCTSKHRPTRRLLISAQGQITPIAMNSIGYRYYYIFIICNFTNAVFFWLLLPETSCRSLEEMDEVFNSPWIVAGKAPRPRLARVEDDTLESQKADRSAILLENVV